MVVDASGKVGAGRATRRVAGRRHAHRTSAVGCSDFTARWTRSARSSGRCSRLAGYDLFDHRIGPVLYLAVIPACAERAADRHGYRNDSRESPRCDPDRTILGTVPKAVSTVLGRRVIHGRVSIANFPDAPLWLRLKQTSSRSSVSSWPTSAATWSTRWRTRLECSRPFRSDRGERAGLEFFAVGYLGLGITTQHATAWGLIVEYGLFTAWLRRRREGLDLNAGRGRAAAQRPGRLPGSERVRDAGRCG